MKYLVALLFCLASLVSAQTEFPDINRPSNEIGSGSGRTPGWQYNGYFNGIYPSVNFGQGYMPNGAWTWARGYMRWPGDNNGIPRTIWFRTGYDDGHSLWINGTQVTNGGCCGWAYGYYTAKPGDIVYLEFGTNNNGGYDWIFQVAWDPQGDGSYELLTDSNVAVESSTGGGGSFWYSSDTTTIQSNLVNTARTRRDGISLGNRIDIDERIGSSGNSVTIEQVGNYNRIQGLGGGYSILDGDNNTINIKQGDTTSGRNLIELNTFGNNNNITIQQAVNVTTGLRDAIESGGHYAGLGIAGNSNTVTIKQGNEAGANSGHFGILYIAGNNNSVTLRQAGNNEKRAFINVEGNTNTSSVYQFGAGNHYVDLALTGNGHTANVTQSGTATHKATINLQNAGGSSVLNLVQQGATGQQYSILQQCANLSGCSVTITQGTP